MRHAKQQGAAALIATMVVASIFVIVILSMTGLVISVRSLHVNFAHSTQLFYTTEAGVEETLFSLKKEPLQLIFSDYLELGTAVMRGFSASSDSAIEALATSTEAARLLRYDCAQDLSACVWRELTP